MNNTIRLNRLNHFVTVLKAVPKEKFKMSHWMKEKYFDQCLTGVVIPSNFIKVSCQTACCALGWAALDKTFNKAGLKVISEEKSGEFYGVVKYKDTSTDEAFGDYDPGARFFGISEKESANLFVERSYQLLSNNIKPEHVIIKVKELIKKYEKVGIK